MAKTERRSASRGKGGSEQPRKQRFSRQQKPEGMTLEQWQVELRKQFGEEQKFRIRNLGEHPVFTDFHVNNPQSGNTYRVRIRGDRTGDNACTCPDFTTNTLGTCKHIEFTLARLRRRRALRAQLKEGYQPPHSEIYLEYGSRREVRFRPGSECPVEVARLASGFFDETGILKPDAASDFETFLREASEAEPDLDCGDDVLAYLAELRDGRRRVEIVKQAFPRGIRSAAFKDLLKVQLYDYQREGALFAARAGRCLIGDEMGLGKTIQALAAAEIMARLFGLERVLIVCPTSLKHQWEREIQRFTERTVGVVGGLYGRRVELYAQPGHFFKITNYDTVHTDLEHINAWAPDLVILDEAQRIKNWATRVARSVKKITTPHAIVLTGTPLENRLEELVSIVQFVDLFRLGPTFRLLDEHQIRNEVGKVVGYKNLDRLGQSLAPILIRRQKEQVLEQLPGRIDTNVFVPLTEQQRKIHDSARELVARIVYKWQRYKFLSEADQRRLMMGLQQMRMVSDSTYLVAPETEFGNKADEAMIVLDELFERPDVKVVVFSQWLRMHELLIRRLDARKIGHAFFHGGLSGLARRTLIDKFRDDPACKVFMATDAGSVGLNLQHACVVVNMDLPWNPAILEQRIGRVHRLGQQQPVRVVNFIGKGSIEEGILGLLSFKKSLFKGVLDGGEKEVFLGGTRLTRFMESVQAATSAIPTGSAEEDAEDPAPAPTPRPSEKEPPVPVPAAAGEPVPTETPTPTPPAPPAPAPVPVPVATPTPTPMPASASPWAGLIEAGLGLLQQLSVPASGEPPHEGNGTPMAFVQRDERTGENYLRLPVPPPEVLTQALDAVQKLLRSFQKG